MKINNKIGFGTYRIYENNLEHFDALMYALNNGVRTIDTSTNYTNGQSELLIGRVIKQVRHTISRDEIRIISKVGYIQGDSLSRVKENNNIKDLVKYNENCFHSIDADFIHSELSLSLKITFSKRTFPRENLNSECLAVKGWGLCLRIPSKSCKKKLVPPKASAFSSKRW